MSSSTGRSMHRFPVNRLGTLARSVEPVGSHLDVDHAQALFKADPALSALPVEHEGRVAGILTRASCSGGHARGGFFGSPTLESLLDTRMPVFRAMESIPRVIHQLRERSHTGDFLIFHLGRYLGMSSFYEVLDHAATLQAQDLDLARNIQAQLMHMDQVLAPTMSVEWYNRMAHEVGGDFIQLWRLGPDTYLLGLFDMAGKGVSAALATSLISSFFSTLQAAGILAGLGMARLMTMLHQHIQSALGDSMFLACAFALAELGEGRLKIFNCALGPVRVLHVGGSERIQSVSVDPDLPPIGSDAFPLDRIKGHSLRIVPGTKVVLCTDGFADMRNYEGQAFGDDALTSLLVSHASRNAATLRETCVGAIDDWIAEAPQADDITFAILEFR